MVAGRLILHPTRARELHVQSCQSFTGAFSPSLFLMSNCSTSYSGGIKPTANITKPMREEPRHPLGFGTFFIVWRGIPRL